jgi:hypothetical protein
MMLFVLADGLAKLFFPTLNSLSPKNAVLPIHRLPLKLAAFLDLRFEKLLPIEQHGLSLIKRGREISVAPAIFGAGQTQRGAPIRKTSSGDGRSVARCGNQALKPK